MSSLIAIPSSLVKRSSDVASLIGCSDADADRLLEIAEVGGWIFASCCRRDAPVSGPRLYDDGNWTICFAGDLIDHDSVPFLEIVAGLRSGENSFLSDLSGVFAFVAYDHNSKRLFVVSDRRSQKPIFYAIRDEGLCVATDLGHLARLPGDWQFNRQWLWELLYFNFPLDSTTFLQGVDRCGPSTILSYDNRSRGISSDSYADIFQPRASLLKDTEAMEFASDVINDRFARHYNGATSTACALTGGWDGRTVLAMAPADSNVTAYTYGGPGCVDLENATTTARKIGVGHITIPFDDRFIDSLPFHAFETVYKSGGLQGVLRSTLHYAYNRLTDRGSKFPLTLSGIAIGTALRGSAQYPDLVSMPLVERFRGSPPTPAGEIWREFFGDETGLFEEWIDSRLSGLETRFGPFASGAHHLAYVIYPGSTSYFAGEVQLSDHFTTLRVPMWDTKVLEAIYSIEPTTLSFSHFLGKSEQVLRKEMLLQAYLLCTRAPAYRHIPVRTNRPWAIYAGSIPYQLDRVLNGIQQRIKYRSIAMKPPALESWHSWLFDRNHEFLAELLQSPDSQICEYINTSVVDSVIEQKNMRILGKLLTTEIILRLIKTRWQKFW